MHIEYSRASEYRDQAQSRLRSLLLSIPPQRRLEDADREASEIVDLLIKAAVSYGRPSG